jgi:hypothetical protein
MKTVCRDVVGKAEGNRLFEMFVCRWNDNIKIDLIETELKGMDWIPLSGMGFFVNIITSFRVA